MNKRGRVDTYMQTIQRLWRALSHRLHRTWISARRWWQQNNRHYGIWWRIGNGAVAVLMLVIVALPIVQNIAEARAYRLSADTLKLIGSTDTSLTSKLTYDAQSQAYQFNKAAIKEESENPFAAMQAQVGQSTGKDAKNLYALDVSKDGSKGVRYYDANSSLSFTLTPDYKIGAGKNIDGHLVFPLDGSKQAVYTLKNNGLKEDIVLQHATQNEMSFSYALNLPKTLEMRVIPNSNGAVGIYSADPALFGDISYSSDSDRAAVQKSRENSEKSYLVFGLPSPVIKNTDGKSVGNARFELRDDTLTVIASGLSNLPMPVTVDPSVIVTSTSDFQYGGNDEGNISFETANQVTRSGLSGGTVGTWTDTTHDFPGVQYIGGFVAYNNYLYAIAGSGNNTVRYALIGSNGTLGAWSSLNSLNLSRTYIGATAYNGYLYTWGGYSSTTSATTATVEYAQILANGQLGSWQNTTPMGTAVCRAGYAAYAGYLYTLGGVTTPAASCGNTSSGAVNTVQYAPIKADGTVGAWSTTTSLAYGTGGAIMGTLAGAYNGYMYAMGGSDAPVGNIYKTVNYAKINNDGTLGAWMSSPDMPLAIYRPGFTIYNGYIYFASDQNSSQTVRYAPIYANGAVGIWRTTTDLTTVTTAVTWGAGLVGYNGYLYLGGGTGRTEVDSVKIYSAGRPSGFTTGVANFATARTSACSVAYNGYFYVIGGTDGANNLNTVRYSTIGYASGATQGTAWPSATVLTTATGGAGCITYSGRIYVVGGYTGAGSPGTLGNNVYYGAIGSGGNVSTWTTGTNTGLPTSSMNKLFIYNSGGTDYLYSVGTGAESSTGYTYRATISPTTGAVGSWSRAETNTSQALFSTYQARGVAQVGKYLYIFGGNNGAGAVTNTVYYATIQSNGLLSDWTSTTALNTALSHNGGATINGCIYSVGGKNGAGTSLAAVQYACPNANGTISAWYDAADLATATNSMATVAYGGYLYAAGGFTTAVVATTVMSFIDNGGAGSTNPWSSSGALITCGRSDLRSVAYNGYLYVTGGVCSGTIKNDVQYAAINADGTLGAFTATSSFTGVRILHGLVAYNGYMYIAGGCVTACTVMYNDVQRAPINSDGTLGSFTTASASFASSGRFGIGMATYNGYMYITGGKDSASTLYADTRYATINSDGSLGAWTDAGNNFTNARYSHQTLIANSYIYVFGGYTGSVVNDVQFALINSNGTIGTWAYTTSFHGIRMDMSAAVSNGFIYIYAGTPDNGTTFLNDVQYAPIYANGVIGAWQVQENTFTNPRSKAGSAIYNGVLYIVGGYDPIGNGDDVQFTPLYSIGRYGHYSKNIDMGATATIISITYSGSIPSYQTPGVSPVTYKTAGSTGYYNSDTVSNVIAGTVNGCDTSSTAYTRYLLVTVRLDDSGGGIFPDVNASNAYLADITVTYKASHPTPDIRLRSGQTLQSGSLSPLDTCYP